MKRAPALIPLARDHHEALVLARRTCKAVTALDDLRDEVLQCWRDRIAPHFGIEERVLFPALAAAGGRATVDQALHQHAQLRALVDALHEGGAATLAAWGTAMTEHVRFEDRELFPLAERLLDLGALAPAMRGTAPS